MTVLTTVPASIAGHARRLDIPRQPQEHGVLKNSAPYRRDMDASPSPRTPKDVRMACGANSQPPSPRVSAAVM
jgi:hypothetical protein